MALELDEFMQVPGGYDSQNNLHFDNNEPVI